MEKNNVEVTNEVSANCSKNIDSKKGFLYDKPIKIVG